MSASYLIFDFGGNEDAVQQARQRVENWQRGFRLGAKLTLQVERPEAGESGGDAKPDGLSICVIVRVDFSDHEKLSRQRWLERIPADEHFKPAKHTLVAPGNPQYDATEEKFVRLASGSAARKFQQT